MSLGKQAKTLTQKQERMIIRELENNRYPQRDKAIFLLSIKAGLRAKEISGLTWNMVFDSSGELGDSICLENRVSKGTHGGRTIPLNKELKEALKQLMLVTPNKRFDSWPVIFSERDRCMSASSITVWFHRLYNKMGFIGCSSHSGRRTFITRAAKKIVEAGGSLRDVQQLAGHSNLSMTQRYIEGSNDAKRRVLDMI